MQLQNSSGPGSDLESILAPGRGPGTLVVQASDDYDGDFDLDFDIDDSDDEDEDEDDDDDEDEDDLLDDDERGFGYDDDD
jgi:hypothetical protein